MNKCFKKFIILTILCSIYILTFQQTGHAACADLDGDGVAETCVGGSSNYKIPTPSAPSKVYSGQSNQNSSAPSNKSHKSSSYHSSSIQKSWNTWDSFTSDLVNSWIQKQKQQEKEQQLLLEQQKLQAEIKKKEDAAKRKAEEEHRQKELSKKRDEKNKWLQEVENKTDSTPTKTTDDELSGKVKLLRDQNNQSMMNPKSDIRVSDIEHMKIKNLTNKPGKAKPAPAYYGPDPKTLNNKELQYQVGLLNSQIAQCDTGVPNKCSPEFLNMLVRAKENYICEMMSRGPINNESQMVSDTITSKLKHFDNINQQNNPLPTNNITPLTQKTKQQQYKLNSHGKYGNHK